VEFNPAQLALVPGEALRFGNLEGRGPAMTSHRHCERSEAIHLTGRKCGLLRRVAPRNDG
jgi:hypothetical protein